MDDKFTKVKDYSQELNMVNGKFTLKYNITDSNELNLNTNIYSVKHNIIILRQYPYCVLQKFTIECNNDSEIDIYLANRIQ